MRKKKGYARLVINVDVVLNSTVREFQSIVQWTELRHFDLAYKSFMQARTLVELVEKCDCGHIGGFDEGQPRTSGIFDRWEWLYEKFVGDAKKANFGNATLGGTYKDVKKFFEKKAE